MPPLVAFPIIVLTRVEKEDALMIEQFGDAYREYIKHTGRFVPKRAR